MLLGDDGTVAVVTVVSVVLVVIIGEVIVVIRFSVCKGIVGIRVYFVVISIYGLLMSFPSLSRLVSDEEKVRVERKCGTSAKEGHVAPALE